MTKSREGQFICISRLVYIRVACVGLYSFRRVWWSGPNVGVPGSRFSHASVPTSMYHDQDHTRSCPLTHLFRSTLNANVDHAVSRATHIFDGLDDWPTHLHYLNIEGVTGWQGEGAEQWSRMCIIIRLTTQYSLNAVLTLTIEKLLMVISL